jgi:hypothetical protein
MSDKKKHEECGTEMTKMKGYVGDNKDPYYCPKCKTVVV